MSSANDIQMLRKAGQIALKGNDRRNYKVGCVARRKDGALVSASNNNVQKPTPSAHAESRALRKAGKGAELWVARIGADGELKLAMPCKRCQALIRSFAVERVVFSISGDSYGVWLPGKEIRPELDM